MGHVVIDTPLIQWLLFFVVPETASAGIAFSYTFICIASHA